MLRLVNRQNQDLNNMDIEKIRELIKRARSSAKNQESRELVGYFEDFIELRHMGGPLAANDAQYRQKIFDAHRRFWSAFLMTAKRNGVSVPEIEERLEKLHAAHIQAERASEAEKKDTKLSLKKMKKNKNKLKA